MPGLRPPSRFLLRGSALLIGFLTLWWFVLRDPMLYGLESGANIAARLVFSAQSGEFMREDASRNWTFQVPRHITVPVSPARPSPLQINSIDFDIPRADVNNFTFGLPVFWALVLAVPGRGRNLRPLLTGTAVMALLELTLLLTFAVSSAHKAAAQLLSLPMGAFETWLVGFCGYLAVQVLPYTAPIIVAISVHPGLRHTLLGLGQTDG